MIKIFIADAVISKGYKDAPAIRVSENKNAVQFKIGKRVYDKNAKDNHRYINLAVKAFGSLCERIEKMQLKESSHINLTGRLDEEQWDDENGQKISRFVIIAEDIEYASSGNGAGSGSPLQNGNGTAAPSVQQPPSTQGEQAGNPSGFTGYGSFGGNDYF